MGQKLDRTRERRSEVRAARRAFLHSKTPPAERDRAFITLWRAMHGTNKTLAVLAARVFLVESTHGGRYPPTWTDAQLEAQAARAERLRGKTNGPSPGRPLVAHDNPSTA